MNKISTLRQCLTLKERFYGQKSDSPIEHRFLIRRFIVVCMDFDFFLRKIKSNLMRFFDFLKRVWILI